MDDKKLMTEKNICSLTFIMCYHFKNEEQKIASEKRTLFAYKMLSKPNELKISSLHRNRRNKFG